MRRPNTIRGEVTLLKLVDFHIIGDEVSEPSHVVPNQRRWIELVYLSGSGMNSILRYDFGAAMKYSKASLAVAV